MKFISKLFVSFAFVLLLFSNNSLVSQETDSSSRLSIEEIIVTGTKRDISQQDVPLAVSTITDTQLENTFRNDVFALGELAFFQSMGFGLGAAVLIDATVVRSILVPSVMKLLGTNAWYLPKFLNWLPNISIEGNINKN